jgi:hypothetical protein
MDFGQREQGRRGALRSLRTRGACLKGKETDYSTADPGNGALPSRSSASDPSQAGLMAGITNVMADGKATKDWGPG